MMKAPGSDSRSSRSFDKYSERGIDNFDAKYHTTSTQSGLNNQESRYLGMSRRVSYDPRRKRLNKNQHHVSLLIVECDSHKKDHDATYPF